MVRKNGSGIILILLVLSAFALVSNIRLVETEPKTIIVPDDYPTIQAAINAAEEGDTILVKAGTYEEAITIDKSLTLTGEGMENTIIDGSEALTYYVVNIKSSNINISGFEIRNPNYSPGIGIEILNDRVNITKNNITKCSCGIRIEANETYVAENEFRGNPTAIESYGANNRIVRNEIVGFEIEVPEEKTGIGINLKTPAKQNIIRENNLTYCQYGIHLSQSDPGFHDISHNKIEGNYYGVYIEKGGNNTVSNNQIRNIFGVYINLSNYNTVSNNSFYRLVMQRGITLSNSNFTIIEENSLFYQIIYGIKIIQSSENKVSDNILSFCREGIQIRNSSRNNIVCNNTIEFANWRGVEITSSSNNTVTHNNLINSTAFDDGTNTWDNGYPSGGNYWNNTWYNGTDKFCGVDQNVLGSDGIGDTQYNITGGDNKDRYPLMNPWPSTLSVFPVMWKVSRENVTCLVGFFSNSSITNFNFDKTLRQIRFNISNGTFCKAIIPKEVLDGALTVFIDDISTASILSWDKTHTFINVTYSEDDHNVKIRGEIATGIIGDITGPEGVPDGKVDIRDIATAAKNFGKKVEDS